MKWLAVNKLNTAAIEVKVTADNSLPYKAVKPHQLRALRHAKKKFLFKPADNTGHRLPCDIIHIADGEGWVLVQFNTDRRGNKEFVMIDVDRFIAKMKRSKRKSITREEAYKIGLVKTLI